MDKELELNRIFQSDDGGGRKGQGADMQGSNCNCSQNGYNVGKRW